MNKNGLWRLSPFIAHGGNFSINLFSDSMIVRGVDMSEEARRLRCKNGENGLYP